MLLVMELFLLVRHTHPPLRMEMEDIHTQNHSCPQANQDAHMFTPPHSDWWRTTLRVSFKHETPNTWGGGSWLWQHGHNWILDYLVIDDFSQGLLRVSEKENIYLKHELMTFTWYSTSNKSPNVVGMQQISVQFSPLWPWGSESSCIEKTETLC